MLAAEEMTVAREACDAERDACSADTSDWIVAEVDEATAAAWVSLESTSDLL